jgi:hypothetical protein
LAAVEASTLYSVKERGFKLLSQTAVKLVTATALKLETAVRGLFTKVDVDGVPTYASSIPLLCTADNLK